MTGWTPWLGRSGYRRHSTFSTWWIISAGLGLLSPIIWFLIAGLGDAGARIAYPMERVIRVVWPSSFWLMATDGIEGTPRSYMFVFLSVAANAVLYALLGSALWCVRRFFIFARR